MRPPAIAGEFEEGVGQAGALHFQCRTAAASSASRRRTTGSAGSATISSRVAVALRASHARPRGDARARPTARLLQRMRRCDTRARICVHAAFGQRAAVLASPPRGRPAPRLPPGNAWSAAPRSPARPVRGSPPTAVCRASMSRPVVGSSRNSSCGRPQIASANCTRRCWPPDSLP